jgi:LysM repeat protein
MFISLLVACEFASSQENLSATTVPETVAVEGTSLTNQTIDIPIAPAILAPVVTETPVPVTSTPLATELPESKIYVIKEGDNLWQIAEEFNTTTLAIQWTNKLVDANAIYIGQELVIPIAPAETQSPPAETPEGMAEIALLSPSATVTMIADDVTPLPSEMVTPGEGEHTSIDRGILHNHILCPAVEEIDQEGGTIIGRSSVCRIPILSYQLGEGKTPLILVGGIHGGYEWNTILLGYRILDHLQQNPELIPSSLVIYLIPNANPDGLFAVTRRTGRFTEADVEENAVLGRFNGNYVDLNRNWDCRWSPIAVWRDTSISGGSAAFSESENRMLRDFILGKAPAATLFLHSAATGVFISGCDQIDATSKTLGEVYSHASGYPLYDNFHYYDVTGDAGDWLASQGIPSFAVELSTHESLDWDMNLAGLRALMNYIATNDGKRK